MAESNVYQASVTSSLNWMNSLVEDSLAGFIVNEDTYEQNVLEYSTDDMSLCFKKLGWLLICI
jgi:hypothetical protein